MTSIQTNYVISIVGNSIGLDLGRLEEKAEKRRKIWFDWWRDVVTGGMTIKSAKKINSVKLAVTRPAETINA